MVSLPANIPHQFKVKHRKSPGDGVENILPSIYSTAGFIIFRTPLSNCLCCLNLIQIVCLHFSLIGAQMLGQDPQALSRDPGHFLPRLLVGR